MQGHLGREADEAKAGLESGPGGRGQHGLRDENHENRVVPCVRVTVRKYFFPNPIFSISSDFSFFRFSGKFSENILVGPEQPNVPALARNLNRQPACSYKVA